MAPPGRRLTLFAGRVYPRVRLLAGKPQSTSREHLGVLPLVAALGLPPQAIWAVVFGLGCIVGSFLNVVIHRLPKMEGYWRDVMPEIPLPVRDRHPICVGDHTVAVPLNVQSRYDLAWPPSACGSCKAPIAWYDNVPVLSWILLGGRCRACKASFSIRYPLVELSTGLLFAAIEAHYGLTIRSLGLAALVGALVACFWIDVDYMILPDSITLPMIWIGLLLNAALGHAGPAVAGAAAGYLVFRAIEEFSKRVFKRDGMGRGDAKLAAMLGAWLGPTLLAAGLFCGFVLGSMTGVVVEMARRKWNPGETVRAIAQHRTRPFPLGPSLVIGGIASLFGGDRLVTWYLGFLRG